MNKEYEEMRDKITKIYGRFPYLIPANQFLSIETDTCRIAVVKKRVGLSLGWNDESSGATVGLKDILEAETIKLLEKAGCVQEIANEKK